MATTTSVKVESVEAFYNYLETYVNSQAKPKLRLAGDAEISRMYLDRLLKRESEVSLSVAMRLANAMETSLEEILKNHVTCS